MSDDANSLRVARAGIDTHSQPVLDKHCVGGLPGNRTTPIVVAIVAAAGHTIPKTSSRAITSPVGTADTMETMAPVALELATLCDPDRLALLLRFAAATEREFGAARVGLVAAYLGYMRQDARFHPGEAVSAPLFARFLEESLEWLVTADPHLHRNPTLATLFGIPAARATTAPLLADWIGAEVPDAVLLGPDSESQQWVAEVARQAGRPYEVLRKTRRGDREVEVSVPESSALRAGTPVVLDDIASSGRTLARAVERLLAAGTKPAVCLVIHAVFAGDAETSIRAAGAARIVSTETIPHPTNAIGAAEALAAAMAVVGSAEFDLDLPTMGRTSVTA